MKSLTPAAMKLREILMLMDIVSQCLLLQNMQGGITGPVRVTSILTLFFFKSCYLCTSHFIEVMILNFSQLSDSSLDSFAIGQRHKECVLSKNVFKELYVLVLKHNVLRAYLKTYISLEKETFQRRGKK